MAVKVLILNTWGQFGFGILDSSSFRKVIECIAWCGMDPIPFILCCLQVKIRRRGENTIEENNPLPFLLFSKHVFLL